MIKLKNARLIDFDPPRVIEKGDLVIDGTRIEGLYEGGTDKFPDAETIDMAGKTVTPGLVCSHNHFYSALARGIMADLKPAADFASTLRYLWWKLDRAIDEDILYCSGLTGSLEALRCGVTSVIDHNASPNFIGGSLAVLKKAFEEVGLRGILCYEVTDRNGEEGLHRGITESADFIRLVEKEQTGLVEAAVGGHALFTMSDHTLAHIADIIQDTGRGFHVHVGEDGYDGSFSHHLFARDLTERMEAFDLLNDKAILAHCVHLTDADIDRINESGAFVVHNPRSNMNNSVGYNTALPRFNHVALGTDGIGSDMLEEFKFAYFKHRDAGGPFFPDAFLRFLSAGNRILERYFGGVFGALVSGARADLAVFDYREPTPLKAANIAGHMAFGLSSSSVSDTMVNGRFVYRNREFILPAEEIYERAAKEAVRLWKRMDELEV